MQRQISAGGVVYKEITNSKSQHQIFWLVTKSRPSQEFPKVVWRLPKGWLDDENGAKSPGLLARGDKRAEEKEVRNAAVREVREEGGIEAEIIMKLGIERHFFTIKGEKVLKLVTFYLMKWIKDLTEGPGSETEKVEWLEYEDTRNRLSYPQEKKMLDKAKEIISSEIQSSLV